VVKLHVLVALDSGTDPLVPNQLKAGWDSELSWIWWQKEKFHPHQKLNPSHPASSHSLC